MDNNEYENYNNPSELSEDSSEDEQDSKQIDITKIAAIILSHLTTLV